MDPAGWPPEAKLLAVEAAVILMGYLAILPALPRKELGPVLATSAALTASVLTVAGLLYWGSGTRFSLLLFETNWAVFAILTYPVLETPFALRFLRRSGIDLSGG